MAFLIQHRAEVVGAHGHERRELGEPHVLVEILLMLYPTLVGIGPDPVAGPAVADPTKVE